MPTHADPVRLSPGGVAIVRRRNHDTVADDPATAPTVVIHPGQLSTTLEGETVGEALDLGQRTWGARADGSVPMVTGTYCPAPHEISRMLLGSLLVVIVIP